MSDKRFYVYILRRPSGAPLYVGKGTGRRVSEHERIARSGDDSFKSRAIRAIWAAGGSLIREIHAGNLTHVDAAALEVELIQEFGRRNLGLGPLVNLTDGGEGVPGHRHSQETRKLIGAMSAGKPRPPHVIAAVVAAHVGATRTEAAKDRMRAAWTDQRKAEHVARCKERPPMTEAQRRAISEAKRGRKMDPEVVAARAAKLKGRRQTDEQRARSGAGVAKSWTPERREAQARRMSEMRGSGLL